MSIILLASLATACSGSSKSKHSDVVLSPELRVLDSATLDQLSSVSADQSTLVFKSTTKQLSALHAGNLIAAGIVGKLLPRGMLRRVESVSGSGPITVTTSTASLTDAVIKGSINPSFHLNADGTTSAALHTAGVGSGGSGGSGNSGLTYGFDNKAIYDGDGDSSTTNDQVLVSGSISIDPLTKFPIQIDSGFSKVALEISGEEAANLSVTAKEAANFTKRIDLDTISFPSLQFNIGPMPVILTPVLTFYAGIDGKSSATLTTSVAEQATLNVGVGYQNGSFGPFNNSSASGTFDPPHFAPGANAKAKAMAGARLAILVDGFDSASVDVDAYARADVEPLKNPWWSLYGGAEASASVHLLGLLNYDAPLGHTEKLLASAPGGSSAAQITSWARAYSGDSSDDLDTLTPMPGGGILAGGTTLSFTSSPADAWLIATDSIGELMWQRAFDDLQDVRVIRPVAGGGFFVATNIAIDPGSNVLMKVDENGAVLSAKELSHSSGDDLRIDDIVPLPDGGALLGGAFGYLASQDFWVAHVDAQANPVWSYAYGGSAYDALHSLADTGDGGCLAVGSTESFPASGSLWALRIGADGKVLWQKSYGTGGESAESALAAPSGGFFLGGESVLDGLAVRLDDSGNVTWATDIPVSAQDAEINGVAPLSGGGFAMAGATNGNAWIQAFASDGSPTWSHEYGGAGSEEIGGTLEFRGVGDPFVALPDGSLLAVGMSTSFTSGDDGWLMHITQNGNVAFASGSGVSQSNPSGSFSAANLPVTTTTVTPVATTLDVTPVTVTVLSSDAKTISQAP